MGGIAFCLVGGGDIQTLGYCPKFTSTCPPRGQGCLPFKRCALVWAKKQLVKLGPAAPCAPSATVGHGVDMDRAIQPRLAFRLGPGLRAGLRGQMGPARAVSLLRRRLLLLLGVRLDAPLVVDGAAVRDAASELLLRELNSSHVKLV